LPNDFGDWENQCETWLHDNEGMLNCLPHFPVLHYRHVVQGFRNVLVGFMGDPSMGSHLSADMIKKPIFEQEALARYLLDRHRWYGVNVDDVQSLFHEPIADRLIALVKESLPSVEGGSLAAYCEAWDFHQRQHKFTLYAVFRFIDHVRYLTPFIDNDLFEFITTMPTEWRLGQRLYFYMLAKYFPNLCQLPTKNYLGLPITASVSRLRVHRFLYRWRRFVERFLLHKPTYITPVTNYVEYEHFLPVHAPLQRYLTRWVREYLDGEPQIGDPKRIEQAWNEVCSIPSSRMIPLTMLITHQMTLAKAGLLS
jgi:hypothetical protein